MCRMKGMRLGVDDGEYSFAGIYLSQDWAEYFHKVRC